MKHVIRHLNEKGDTAVAEWDPADPAEVENAKSKFDALLEENGFTMFKAYPNEKPEGPVRIFDPSVKEYLAVKRFAGG